MRWEKRITEITVISSLWLELSQPSCQIKALRYETTVYKLHFLSKVCSKQHQWPMFPSYT